MISYFPFCSLAGIINIVDIKNILRINYKVRYITDFVQTMFTTSIDGSQFGEIVFCLRKRNMFRRTWTTRYGIITENLVCFFAQLKSEGFLKEKKNPRYVRCFVDSLFQLTLFLLRNPQFNRRPTLLPYIKYCKASVSPGS